MTFKKLVHLKDAEKEGLESIQGQIIQNGGDVSIMELINDAIEIFTNKYKDKAILRYSPAFYNKNGDE